MDTKNYMRRTAEVCFYYSLAGIFMVMPYIPVLRYGFPLVPLGETSLAALSKDFLVLIFIATGMFFLALRQKNTYFDRFEISLIFLICYAAVRVFVTASTIENSLASFRHEIIFIIFSAIFYRLCKIKNISLEKIDKLFSAILLFNFFAVVCLGFLELYSKEFLSVLYGEKANNLVTGIPGVPQVRSVSTLENPINLAMYLTLSAAFFFNSSKIITGRSLILALFAFPLVLGTLSRFFVALYILIVFYCFISYVKNANIFRKSLILTSLIVAIIYFAFSFDFSLLDGESMDVLGKRIEQTATLFQDADDPRFNNWALALKEVMDIPLLGILMGIGLGISNPGELSPGQFRIENTYISIFVQLGFLGCIAFFYPYWIVIKSYRRNISENYFLGVKYLSIVFVILIGGVGNDTHRNMPFSFYLWFSLAMAALFFKERE